VAAPHPVALRADARLNRERILSVAYKAFAEDPGVSLNTIGKLAGVGAGTLYRHFPTREDLILAVYRQELQSVVDSVPDLVGEYPPLEALSIWLLRLADFARIKQGFGEALHTAAGKDVADESNTLVTEAIAVFLRAAAMAGEVRPGLEAADILLLMGFLWSASASDDDNQQARRVLALAIAGLQ
jgi:AcrR family transcriptional regulator